MLIQGMIGALVAVCLFTCFSGLTKHGIYCTEDFGKPITDPCCDNVRVHYKQRTVYEILSLQHDDLQRGINCFQRVCPSQFPAFYRVMYVGGFPGTTVSFAVCSDGEQLDQDGQSRSSWGRRRKRSVQRGRLKVWSRSNDTRGNVNQEHRSETSDNYRHYVFRHLENSSRTSQLFGRGRVMNKPKPGKSGDNVFSNQATHNFGFSRRRREADTSRTIFEIPEPRPSIVYTLTGVCFCLKVQSNTQSTEDVENFQPSDTQADLTYRFIAAERNNLHSLNKVTSSYIGSHENNSKNILSTKRSFSRMQYSKDEKQNRLATGNAGVDCSSGECIFPKRVKRRRRRSTFLDSFMKAVLEAHQNAKSQSTFSTEPITPSPAWDTTRSPSHTQTSSGFHRPREGYAQSVTRVPKPVNNASTPRYSHRQLKNTTLKYNDRNHRTSGMESRGRRIEDEVSDDEESTDSPVDSEEFKDKLVVFASFSHDVHFIGSITMTVSVASSCRSNVPLSPETNITSNETTPTSPVREDRTTTRPVPMTSSNGNIVTNRTKTTPAQESSTHFPTTTPPKDETIPKSLVDEVTDIRHDDIKDDDENDTQMNVLLAWQISAGVTFAVLLVLILVLFTSFHRRRKRKQRQRYSSVTSESTLQRLQHQPATNSSQSSEAQMSALATSNPQQHSSTTVPTVPGTVTIPRTIQAISENEPPQIFNVGTVYPMHIRLRSLSSAAEAARLRGQDALRMLNNETGNENHTEQNDSSLASMKPTAAQRAGAMSRNVDINGYSRANNQNIIAVSTQNNEQHSQKHNLFSPTIVVSEGSNTREFDLGQFAVYRNDIMLKLRRCGLRTGRRKRKQGSGRSQDYDNEENYGTESVYSCYAGGETDI